MNSKEQDELALAWKKLKTVFMAELTRILTPILEKIEAFLNRHPWLMKDNRFTRFLDRAYEVEVGIWRWFWK